MISSLDKSMHQVRSARGADGNVEAREKARAALDEDIADATALLRTARRSGVNASRLIGKIEATEKLLKKEHHSIEDASSGNDSVYNRLALDTGRSDQFDKKTLFEGILANKLPQFKHKWIVRWSRKEQANGPLIFFIDFIDYLKTAVRIARNLDRCDAATKEVKRDVSTKDPGFPKTAFRRADGASYKGDAAFKGDAAYRGDAYLRGGATQSRDAAYRGDAYLRGDATLRRENSYYINAGNAGSAGSAGAFYPRSSGNDPSLLHPTYADNSIEVNSESYCVMCEKVHSLTGCTNFLALSPDDRTTLC